ncbi:MAG: glycosyltransferase [Planctomycetes bacterium]|nr:glycosyltransferase [Planctomycetota bacterium]
MYLSIIIPAYNEGHKIAGDVVSAADFLARNNLTGEIIVVDDGSTDGTAAAAKDALAKAYEGVEVKVICLDANMGKGFAVKKGILSSCGDYVAFVDCGCCVPYDYLLKGIELIRNDPGDIDIAHASRKLNKSTIHECQSFKRRMCSWLFKRFLVILMGGCKEFTDTQCGFKVYRSAIAHELFGECVTDGFMFDVEIILRAQKRGYRISEFPIEWTCDIDSRLSPSKKLIEILRELITIKKALSDD